MSRRLRPTADAVQIEQVVVADLAGRPVLESVSLICYEHAWIDPWKSTCQNRNKMERLEVAAV